jgi:hypothetical protein
VGGEKLKEKRQKETKHKQQEGEAKETSFFCPREPARQGRLSVGREREWGAGRDTVKKGDTKCPHNRQRSQ